MPGVLGEFEVSLQDVAEVSLMPNNILKMKCVKVWKKGF
jgi:hypothetical protein